VRDRICSGTRGTHGIGLLIILLVPLGFFAGALLGNHCLVTSSQDLMAPWSYGKNPEEILAARSFRWDATLNYYPRRALAHEAWMRGELPLWNPRSASGMPLLADFQSAVYYPPNLVLNLGDPLRAMAWAVFLHVVLAGAGTYAFLRNRSLRVQAAVLGGVAYMMSGFLMTRVGHPTMVQAAAWVPWLFLAVDRVVTGGGRWAYAALSGVVALSILSGFPQVTVHSFAAAGLYFAWRSVEVRPPSSRILWSLAFGAVGVGLAGLQILPTLELARESGRTAGGLAAGIWKTPAVSFLGLLVPGFTGNPVEHTNWIALFKGPDAHPNDLGLVAYVGVLPLVLALAALSRWRRDPEVRFFAGLTALVALGAMLRPLFALLYLFLPGAASAQADRLAFLLSFALAVLAARGFSSLDDERGEGTRGTRRTALVVAVASLVVIAALAALLPALLSRVASSVSPAVSSGGWDRPLSPRVRGFLGRDLAGWAAYERLQLIAPGVFLAATVILIALWARARRTAVLRWSAVALAALDLVLFARAYYTPQPMRGALEETPGIRFLRAGADPLDPSRIVRAFSDQVLPPNLPSVLGLDDAQGYNALMVDRYGALFDLASPGSYAQSKKIDAPTRPETFVSPLLDLLNVEFVLAEGAPEAARALSTLPAFSGPGLELVYAQDLLVYRNAGALPRALWMTRGKAIESPEEIRAELVRPGYDPSRVCLVEAAEREIPWWCAAGGSPGEARIVDRSPQRVAIETESAGSGWLRWAETFYPGWRVKVDGAEVLSWRSDLALRAVPLPAGAHRVELTMDPASTRVGFGVTFFSIVLLAVCALSFRSGPAVRAEVLPASGHGE
jgi:hypothetical protein